MVRGNGGEHDSDYARCRSAVGVCITRPHSSRRYGADPCDCRIGFASTLLGLGLIAVFDAPDWTWLNYLYDDTIAVAVLAQSLRAFPLVFFLVWQALRTIPQSLFETAQLDGAGRFGRLWLAIRQRWAAIALAGLAAAVLSIGELAATILVVPPGIEPLSVRVFGLLHFNVEDQVAGISLMLILSTRCRRGPDTLVWPSGISHWVKRPHCEYHGLRASRNIRTHACGDCGNDLAQLGRPGDGSRLRRVRTRRQGELASPAAS